VYLFYLKIVLLLQEFGNQDRELLGAKQFDLFLHEFDNLAKTFHPEQASGITFLAREILFIHFGTITFKTRYLFVALLFFLVVRDQNLTTDFLLGFLYSVRRITAINCHHMGYSVTASFFSLCANLTTSD